MLRKTLAASVVLALCLCGIAVAGDAAGKIQGTITKVDMDQKTLIVKDSNGQEKTFFWDSATKVSGDLKEGASVTLGHRSAGQDGRQLHPGERSACAEEALLSPAQAGRGKSGGGNPALFRAPEVGVESRAAIECRRPRWREAFRGGSSSRRAQRSGSRRRRGGGRSGKPPPCRRGRRRAPGDRLVQRQLVQERRYRRRASRRPSDLMTPGSDVLDALIEGVNIVELDPEDYSVGYGGVPNADGVVQLDSCCMHGPLKRAGAVASLEGVRTPSRVAREVMNQTDHHLLVGQGAQKFARNMGFKIEDDLNTELSRKLWLEWKQRTDPQHYLDAEGAGDRLGRRPAGRWWPRGSSRRPILRHDQLRRDQREGRDLRRDDDLRPLLQDPRTRRRLADPRRRALCGRRRSAPRVRRAAARPTSTTSPRSSSSKKCAAACIPRMPAWRR